MTNPVALRSEHVHLDADQGDEQQGGHRQLCQRGQTSHRRDENEKQREYDQARLIYHVRPIADTTMPAIIGR